MLLTPKAQDGLRYLEAMLGDCEFPDEHSWKKCKRCMAIHGLENRFKLPMQVLKTLIDEVKEQ